MTSKTETLKNIFLTIFLVFLMILLVVILCWLFMNNGFHFQGFKEWCLNNGGEYREIQNITCQILKPNCYQICDFPNRTIDFYDERTAIKLYDKAGI